jgi:hypothetical protein
VNLGKLRVPLVIYRPPSSSPDPTLFSHESKALKHGHCRVRTSSIGANRGDDGIWIYGLVGSFIIFNNIQIASGRLAGSSCHQRLQFPKQIGSKAMRKLATSAPRIDAAG